MYVLAVLALFLAFLALWYLKFLWSRRKLYIYSWKTPGPFALPVVGNLLQFPISDPCATGSYILSLMGSFPGLMRIWFGPILVFVPSKPEYVERLLNHALEKHFSIRLNDFPGRTGLISSIVKIWRTHRKVMMPAFNQKILDSYVEIFDKKASILCQLLDKHVGKKDSDLFGMVSRCTLDITCATAIGVDMDTQVTDSNYFSSMNRLLELVVRRAVNLLYHFDFIWNLSPTGRTWKEPFKVCRDFSSHAIRRKMEEQIRDQSEHLEAEPKTGTSILDRIMKTEQFTEQELNDEIDTILTAGSETSSTTLMFMMITLGMNQDIQDKVYEEVIDIVGQDVQVEPHHLSRMKYMERALKETLRIFPTAPLTLRTLATDLQLDDEYRVPEGSSVLFLLPFIHRDPTYWPDPLKFDPDRFLPENTAKRHPYSYIPFMGGPRNCIGGRFAMMNMMTIMVHMIRKYRFFTEYKDIKEIELTMLISLKAKHGHKVWIERRLD